MNIENYSTFVHQYNWLLIVALSLYILSVLLFETIRKKRYSLLAIFLGSISLFSYIALSYPFLHVWDEQFHALVAKNMGTDFFTPILIQNPILDLGNSWADTHIWLHKQPYFLWQMALSMKIFGINTFSLRIPDIIMASTMPILIYRIGTIIQSKSLGFYAGLLFLSSSFVMMLVSGQLNTDHNDLAFIFYVTASFWAWFEYKNSNKQAWLIAIGLFSGISILVKWLVGLIVYAGWGITIIIDKEKRFRFTSYSDLLKSLLITMAVALPWQIYILFRFPIISRIEYAYNSLHLYEAVEGHGGNWQYHFEQWNNYIASNFQFIIPISLVLFLFLKIKKTYKIAIASWLIIITAFYGFAATKMPVFTFIISALMFIILVAPWDALLIYWNKVSNKKLRYLTPILRVGIIALAFYTMFNLSVLENHQNWRRNKWKAQYAEALTFKKISALNLSSTSHFYNFYFHGAVRFMFHTNYQGRSFLPSETDMQFLKSKGISIYVFDNGELPNYILKDKSITKIKSPIWPDSQVEDLVFYK